MDNIDLSRYNYDSENGFTPKEIKALRQQKIACEQALAEWTKLFNEWDSPGEVHESLIGTQKDVNALQQQLVESLAREKVLRDALQDEFEYQSANYDEPNHELGKALAMPSDSTALDSAIRQAKREILLEAASTEQKTNTGYIDVRIIQRMAKNV